DGASITSDTLNAVTIGLGHSLTLQDTSFIAGGVINNNGNLNLQGASALKNGALNNDGTLTASGANTLDDETVENDAAGSSIQITGSLTLLNGSSIVNGTDNVVTVGSGGSLTLTGTSGISGGELNNSGDIYIEESTGAAFDGVDVNNTGGTIHVDSDA